MDNNSAFVHPASLPNRKLSHPSKMLTPNVDFNIFLSSSVHCEFIRELYTRMVSKCKIRNGNGAMKPSCVAMTDMSSLSFSKTSPSALTTSILLSSIFLLAVILKNGPTVSVDNCNPLSRAISSSSSFVTYDDGDSDDDDETVTALR